MTVPKFRSIVSILSTLFFLSDARFNSFLLFPLRSTRAAQAYMKNSPLYKADDVMKVNSLVSEGRKRIRVDKYVGGGNVKNGNSQVGGGVISDVGQSLSAGTVPEGWQIRLSGPHKSVEFVAPDGATFDSRSAALRHMVLSGYSPEEQEEMRGHLRHEGWTDSPLIPTGWKVIVGSDDDEEEITEGESTAADYTFLTQAGEVLDSIEAAIEHLADSGGSGGGEEDVRRLKQLQEKETKNSSGRLAAKYDWQEDVTVPTG